MKLFLILAICTLPSFAHADTLVISHPQHDEIMQGTFTSALGNDVSFNVDDYDSNASDQINASDFDTTYDEWHVRLNLFGEETVDFTYHCVATRHVGAIILYCAD